MPKPEKEKPAHQIRLASTKAAIWKNATILVHPREVFRLAIMAAASAIVIVSKHPSGEPEPSEADIRVTRDLIRAGQLFIIEVCDHIIMGNGRQTSLKTLGCFTR